MRLSKSLLSIAAALALAGGTAFAGEGYASIDDVAKLSEAESSNEQFTGYGHVMPGTSIDNGGPQLLSEAEPALLNEDWGYGEQELLAQESDVIYVYPMQVTEYYLLVPDTANELG